MPKGRMKQIEAMTSLRITNMNQWAIWCLLSTLRSLKSRPQVIWYSFSSRIFLLVVRLWMKMAGRVKVTRTQLMPNKIPKISPLVVSKRSWTCMNPAIAKIRNASIWMPRTPCQINFVLIKFLILSMVSHLLQSFSHGIQFLSFIFSIFLYECTHLIYATRMQ